MNCANNYPASTIKAAAFIKRNWSNCRLWPRASLLAWLQWFVDNDRFRAVKMDGKIVGVSLYRFVDSAEGVEESEYGDTGGDLCYIVLCVAKADDAMRALYQMTMDGGMKLRSKICWARAKHSGKGSIFDMSKLNRRFNYG